MVEIGDRVVVRGRMETPVYVKEVKYDPSISRTIIFLNWGSFGESKVYLDDEGKDWYLYKNNN